MRDFQLVKIMGIVHVTQVQGKVVVRRDLKIQRRRREIVEIGIVDQRIKQWILSKKTSTKLDSSTPPTNDTSPPTL